MESLLFIATVGPTELGIILLIVLLLFGASKLPKLARSLGQAQREFRTGLNEDVKNSNATSRDNTKDTAGADTEKAHDSGADTEKSLSSSNEPTESDTAE